MNTILQQTEQRLASVKTDKEMNEQMVLEAIRDVIGRQYVDDAEGALPGLEETCITEFLPFTAQLRQIIVQASTPLPVCVEPWLVELEQLATRIPAQVREGIAEFQHLSFSQVVWKDGRSVDENQRDALVGDIRGKLRSHDGAVSRMRFLKRQIEQKLNETGWSDGSPHEPTATAPAASAERVCVEV